MYLKSITAAVLLSAISFGATAQTPQNEAPEYEFKTIKELPITSIKNQYMSGTCWCFSGLAFIESELIRMGKGEHDLSEMFVVSHSYSDRAVKYVRMDGKFNFSAGSSCEDVLHVINDYGIVPQEAMPGFNYGEELPVHGEIDAVTLAYVQEIAKRPNGKLSTAWKRGFDGILAAYFGEYPETFTYQGQEYTPKSFAESLGINPDDYVSITSYTHHPFYTQFVLEICDNWRWDYSYNLPLDDMMEIMYNSIDKGYTIAWGSDVSERGFTRDGLAVVVDESAKKAGSDQEKWVGKSEEAQPEKLLPVEKEITQELRQIGYDNKTTTDDHGMLIYGIAEDQDGNRYFMVKNSWGDAGKYHGIWYASDAFVRYKTMNIIVHKDAIPKDIRKKLGIK